MIVGWTIDASAWSSAPSAAVAAGANPIWRPPRGYRSPRSRSLSAATWTRSRSGRSGGSSGHSRPAVIWTFGGAAATWTGPSTKVMPTWRAVDGPLTREPGLGARSRGHVPHLRRARLDRYPWLSSTDLVAPCHRGEDGADLGRRDSSPARPEGPPGAPDRAEAVRFGARRNVQPPRNARHSRGSSPGDAPSRGARRGIPGRERGHPAMARRAARLDPRSLVSSES